MDALQKQTNFSGGISTGGGDNGSDAVPMPARMGLRMNANKLTGTISIPTNTLVSVVGIEPMKANGVYTAPTAGTVNIGVTGTLTKYANAVSLVTRSTPAAATVAVTTAAEDVIFTATGLDGDCIVYLEVTSLEQAL